MLFGSDEMKQLLLESLEDPDKYAKTMLLLKDVVYEYVEAKLKSGAVVRQSKASKEKTEAVYTKEIPLCDYEGIQSDVYFEVYTSLDRFILSLKNESYAEAQRQAWLKTITLRVIADYFDKKKQCPLFSVEDGKKDIADPKQQIVDDQGSAVVEIIRMVNEKHSKAEAKLAYLLNVLVYREMYARKKNNTPTVTAQNMEGKSLHKLMREFAYHVRRIYGIRVKKSDVSSLVEAFGDNDNPTAYGKKICLPGKDSDKVCHITSVKITDWTNRINTYLYRMREQ